MAPKLPRIGLLIATLLASTAVSVPVPAAADESVYLTDDFRDPKAGLLPTDSPTPAEYELGYTDGEFVLRNLVATTGRLAGAFIPGVYGDSYLRVDVRLVGQSMGRQLYVSCRASRSVDSAYRAIIEPDAHRAQLIRRVNGTPMPLVTMVNDAIKSGEETNHIELWCEGNLIRLAVNGTRVALASDSSFTAGQLHLGLARAQLAEAHFSNLVVDATPGMEPAPAPAAPSIASVAQQRSGSIVSVFAGRPGSTSASAGSGVRIPEGVLTAAHVIRGASIVEVAFGGVRVPATVTKIVAQRDLALLRADLPVPPLPLQPAGLQRRGDPVAVIGFPRGTRVSGPPHIGYGSVLTVIGQGDLLVVGTDADMNPGDSGGAMIDAQGRLVAVNSFGLRGPEGTNLGIASEGIAAFLAGPSDDLPGPDDLVAGDILFEDDFEDATASRLPSSVSEERGTIGAVDGEYRMRLPAGNGRLIGLPGLYRNSRVEIDVRPLGATPVGGVELQCRAVDPDWAYGVTFFIDEQTAVLNRFSRSGRVELASATTDAIIRGSATNRLVFECAGNKLIATVNDTQVAEAEDDSYGAGFLGLGLWRSDSSAAVAFDNLVITQP